MSEASTTSIDRESVLAGIRQQLREQREVDPERVNEDTDFREDLLIDSLDLAAMALALETEYGIRLDDEAVLNVETVGDACDLILEAAGATKGT
jgi:acyl carrier protein